MTKTTDTGKLTPIQIKEIMNGKLGNEKSIEFIVHACNSHSELLEACKYVLPYLEISEPEHEATKIIKQAIAKAQGK